ncbi:ABC transporter substrate-binding protein [Actinomadura flavalba]|uniref:ABC transporter substrate-binding protein n=1 Tax=Actinomadura flavalba TaxID=1120938 RepID=UPI0003617104|nr:ABC transporter substrate-binding protein [Actinomadura flavalba]
MGSGHEPRGDRLEGLESLFERLRERPPRRAGDRLRPVLVLAGADDDLRHATQRLVERASADGGPVGHLHGASGSGARTDMALLLRHLARRLSGARLRFPLLSMVLWLLEVRRMRLRQEAGQVVELTTNAQRQQWQLAANLRDAEEDAQRRTLLARAIQRRRRIVVPADQPGGQGRMATVLGHLEQVAPIGVAVVALVSAGAASTLDLAAAMIAAGVGVSVLGGQVAARTRDRAGRRRYRWFASAHQTYLRGRRSVDFLGLALDVVFRDESGPGPLDDAIERLLVAAFLQDLRIAYRRGARQSAWARVRYPAVVAGPLPEDDPARAVSRRLVRWVEEIRRREERFDPLVLVLAAASEQEAADLAGTVAVRLGGTEPADLAALRETPEGQPFWAAYERRRHRVAVLGTARTIRVNVRGDGSSAVPVHRGRRRPFWAHPALPWLAMGAVLAASVAVIAVQAVRYCAPFDVWHAANRECVGVTDGSTVFTDRLKAVQDRIADENRAVADSGKPYVTLVYLGAMTIDPATRNPQADLLAGIHGELVGLSIAQRQHNQAGGAPRLRVLLANAGSRFRYAREVAVRVRELAEKDRSIVAVVGFGQSRRPTSEAIEVLGRSALPMIGTTNTYDGTARDQGGFSPYYFRLAPPNARLARHAAHWARTGRAGVRARTADVFYDTGPDDLYSRNLAADFARSFGGRARMLPYADPSQVPGRVLEACQNPADVFYYAGRSDEFRLFINRLANTDCRGRRVVLAADEVTKYVSDNGAEIGRTDSIRLLFTPLAAREAWTPRWIGDRPLQNFYSSFDPVVNEIVGASAPANIRPSRAHAALGYDAARTVAGTAERVYGERRRTLPTAAAILSELTEPGPGAQPQGATGLLSFGPRSTGHQVPGKPVLLAAVQPNGTLTMVAVCGTLVRAAQNRGDCP